MLLAGGAKQGERLDWWRSGVFNALFAGGALFLPWRACFVGYEVRIPLVALALSAESGNTVAARIPCSSASASLCARPSFLCRRQLAIQRFRSRTDWTRRSSGVAAPTYSSRAYRCTSVCCANLILVLLLAIGPLPVLALAAWLDSQYSHHVGGPRNFPNRLTLPEFCFTGRRGRRFAFIGTRRLHRAAKRSSPGLLAKPEWVLTFSAFLSQPSAYSEGTAGAIYNGPFFGATRESCTRT